MDAYDRHGYDAIFVATGNSEDKGIACGQVLSRTPHVMCSGLDPFNSSYKAHNMIVLRSGFGVYTSSSFLPSLHCMRMRYAAAPRELANLRFDGLTWCRLPELIHLYVPPASSGGDGVLIKSS